MFFGGNPEAHEETAEYYKKWAFLFDLFEWCKDYKTGALLHLPCSGGVLDQPAKTMSLLGVMKEVWLERLAESLPVN